MSVVRELRGIDVVFGGEEHRGWLPKGAAKPPPTPTSVVRLDFEIRESGGGYVFVWQGPDSQHCGDTWHPSLVAALEQAKLWFGIECDQWKTV
jgi:hypothetical protein